MFDSDRLEETHVPGGWIPLNLKPRERAELIAFLRTL
jgi:hypothetical protein